MNNLKNLRIAKNKTQEEVACELGIKKQTYQTYELGKREPNIDMLIKLANFYNVSIDYMVKRDWKDASIQPWKLTDIEKENLSILQKLTNQSNLIANGYLKRLLDEQEKDKN